MIRVITIKDSKGIVRKVGKLFITKSGRIYFKRVNRKKHYMRIVQGYGIQKEVFEKYLRGRKGSVVINETDTGDKLVASIKTWIEHSSAANYGDGKQIFLSEKYMEKSNE